MCLAGAEVQTTLQCHANSRNPGGLVVLISQYKNIATESKVKAYDVSAWRD